MTSLENLLAKLRRPEFRYWHASEVYSKLPRKEFPHSTIPALDKLLDLYSNDALKKPIILVEYNKTIELKPCLNGNSDWKRYQLRVLGGFHSFGGTNDPNPAPAIIDIQLKKTNIYFNMKTEDEERQIVKAGETFLFFNNLNNDMIKHSKGVAIKTLNEKGEMKLCHYRNYGVENAGMPVISFFNKDDLFTFDLFGNIMDTALPLPESKERKILKTAYDIESRSEDLQMDEILTSEYHRLKDSWNREPSDYNGKGNHFIMRGKVIKKVRKDNSVGVSLYDGDKRVESISISRSNDVKFVNLVFKGYNIMVYDMSGELLNARANENLLCFTMPNGYSAFETMSLLTLPKIRKNRTPWVRVGNKNYFFSKQEIREELGVDINDYEHVGIFAYSESKEEIGFELWLKNKEDDMRTEKIIPYRSESSKI